MWKSARWLGTYKPDIAFVSDDVSISMHSFIMADYKKILNVRNRNSVKLVADLLKINKKGNLDLSNDLNQRESKYK